MRREEIGKTDKSKIQEEKREESKRAREKERKNIDEVIATDLVSVYVPSRPRYTRFEPPE